MTVDNNEIHSFVANSSITDEITRINIISRRSANKVQPSITQLDDLFCMWKLKDLLNSNKYLL